MPTDAFKSIFNDGFDIQIPDGTDGNQAQYGIFFKDELGRFRRITQAEGNEISYNPETVTRNLIANENPAEFIRRYQLQFSKGILIRKGDFEYEFFNKFRELLPTGANAQLVIMLVDFRKGEAGYTDATTPVPTGRFNYKAIQFTATVTINTGNETDGLLDLSFGQASDIVSGVASSESFTETSRHPVFVPSTSIAPSMMNLSDSAATLALGEEKWIAVGMEPMGCLEAFEIVRTGGAGHDERICEARIVRNSVIITGKKAGETSVTLRSLAENGPSKTIAVKVGGGAQPVGSGAALPSGRTMAPAKTDAGKPSVE